MNTVDDSDRNPGEWLSIGRNSTQGFKETEPRARPKIFSCNYCKRKFYSSQALGGHQNAHKRERGAIRNYQSQRIVTMMAAPPVHTSMIRSLGVHPHSLVHKPGRDVGVIVARFNETDTEFGNAWETKPMEEAMGSIWPGSFRLDQQQLEQPPINLDLNLKL